jgi:hypothetical protein
MYPKECKSTYKEDTYMVIFIALFTIDKLCNQGRYPQITERIERMWYINTMECYSAIKKKEIVSSAEKWT